MVSQYPEKKYYPDSAEGPSENWIWNYIDLNDLYNKIAQIAVGNLTSGALYDLLTDVVDSNGSGQSIVRCDVNENVNIGTADALEVYKFHEGLYSAMSSDTSFSNVLNRLVLYEDLQKYYTAPDNWNEIKTAPVFFDNSTQEAVPDLTSEYNLPEADIVSSSTQEGYYTFPGGYTMQWGYTDVGAVASGSITFHKTFDYVYGIQLTSTAASTDAGGISNETAVRAGTLSTSGVELSIQSSTDIEVYWMAYGLILP